MLESKRKAIIFIVLSILLAVTAGFLVLKKVQSLNTNLGTSVKIFIANEDISSRTLITPDNVEIEEIPKKFFKKDYHVTDVDDLVNKVSVVPLSPGDRITENILKPASNVIEENNRLITLIGNERVFFDEQLELLDRVDIIVSHRFNGKEETNIFMQDVKVANVAKKDKKFVGVKLEVSLEKAPELIHMQNYADSLRIIKANVGKQEATKEGEAAKAEEAKTEPQPENKEEPKQEANDSQPKKEDPKSEQPAKPEEKPKQE
jgi:Flp pilus assembly protein CpaB